MPRPKSNNRDKIRYRMVRCPHCGRKLARFIPNGPGDMIMGPGDSRAGAAHTHRCYLDAKKHGRPIYSPSEDQYPRKDERAILRSFGF